ncbi:MAG: glutaminyl-peptide cyclotransferase [Bacteroidetes bacterium]|nr:glutaminyl-peptide cyclotransferase [Bacteroidota bacterium]
MNRLYYLGFFVAFLVIGSCSSKQTISYKIITKTDSKKVRPADTIHISLNTLKDANSHQFYWNNEALTQPFVVPQNTGEQQIKAIIETENGIKELTKNIRVFSSTKPKVFTYKLVNTYPHDINAYTQGLEFVGDTLYESTGQYGASSLRKVDYKSGTIIQNLPLDNAYFGEGLTYINGKIIQLTWKKKLGFVYNSSNLTLEKSFKYTKSPEGWGLCTDGEWLYKTDGSQKLWRLDPNTFEEVDSKDIVTHNTYLSKVNELEFVNGLIYGNTYQFNKDVVVIIEPNTGVVQGVVDFSGLKKRVSQHNRLDVFNGIAFHPKRNTFFVTGKYWDKLFEVEIIEK